MSTNKLNSAQYPGETLRTFVSLLIFMHLFCVAMAMSSCFSFSQLQGKLVELFFPYTRAIHSEPNYLPVDRRVAALPPVPFHLTTGEGETRMHQWLLTTANGTTLRFPNQAWPRQHRADRLARLSAYFSERLESDEVPAEVVKAMCTYMLPQLTEDDRKGSIHVRCLRHRGEDEPLSFDVNNANVDVLYEADVWFDGPEDAPTINVLKRVPQTQSAPPVSSENT